MLKTSAIPVSLYIHTPWCVRKCPYCDFNSHALRGSIPEKEYLAALLRDWESAHEDLQGRSLTSLFIGGGTPSLMSPEFYANLFSELQKTTHFPENMEITLEANPGTVEQARFTGFHNAGINRISIGIQSFNPDKLKILGRIHNAEDAKKAIIAAQNSGFSNINLDLMHGLPGQTLEEALLDLQTALLFNTTHLSWYQLTLEPNTIFHKFPPPLPDEDLIAIMQEKGRALLAEHGFLQYEVSAYARQQIQSQHNVNYWKFGDYIGIGAGAHGKITDEKNQKIRRISKIKHPTQYLLAEKKVQEEKIVSSEELPFEFMMNALRLNQPIPIELFTERTGLSLKIIEKPLDKLTQDELLFLSPSHFNKTPLGEKFLNNVLEYFL